MDARLIAVAIPIFFALIALERVLLRRRVEPVYHLYDTIADLSCGVGQQTLQVFLFVVELGLYTFVWTRFRVHTFAASSVGAWILLILLVDLAYYWFHRASHRVNFLWAVHGVHHQSEEFNLSVALRQGWIEPLMIAPFHVLIAVAGFPPAMFFVAFTLHTVWQFWPHTRGIGPLPIDGVFNTPANHRVHHGINPAYIDKNYSGFLILWDRLFGTWTPEAEEPVYGTVKPLSSFNPLWANLSYWTEMVELARRCPRIVDKLSVPFRPPEWRPAALGGPVTIPPVERATQRRYAVAPPRAMGVYAVAAFVLALLASSALANPPVGLPWGHKLVAAAFIVVTLATVAGLVENKAWARPLEVARLLSIVPLTLLLFGGTAHAQMALVVAVGLALAHGLGLAWALRTPALSHVRGDRFDIGCPP